LNVSGVVLGMDQFIRNLIGNVNLK